MTSPNPFHSPLVGYSVHTTHVFTYLFGFEVNVAPVFPPTLGDFELFSPPELGG